MHIYTTPLNTIIFLTSKSYGGIKLVWIWRISTWLKLFKYINLTQSKIIIFALMHNIRTHPFYFWYTLYTQTPFLTAKPINPPFYPFSDLFKPTLSEAWVAHYEQSLYRLVVNIYSNLHPISCHLYCIPSPFIGTIPVEAPPRYSTVLVQISCT